ncbi:hypothetical protein [Shimia abyssi]|uniref:Uncharacterized protein n=1 Tax=Shimia abyssi TaxID=1662395 RepID=A0A2P8FAC3_9RHOB|nr:hypothetical protein [Shimia abyssi]PSL18687.1 hypothetical protein CLV88_10972 [Shimia abyssi]
MAPEPEGRSWFVVAMCAAAVAVVIGLVAIIAQGTASETQLKLIDKLLDWPVLGFVTLMVIFCVLGRELVAFLTNANIKIAGLIEIEREVADVSSNVDENIAELQARIDALEAAAKAADLVVPKAEPPVPVSDDESEIYAALLRGLSNSNYTWRSLERIGYEVGITDEDEVARILRKHGTGEVRMGKGKSGKTIARVN